MQVGKQATASGVVAALLVTSALALSSLASHGADQSHVIGQASDQASSGSVLTRDQAIRIAAQFCSSVGSPASGKPIILFPAPPRYTFQQDSYWLPRWRITFPDGAEVEVVDSTFVVSRFDDLIEQKRPEQPKINAAGAIPENQAIKQANTALAAAGAKSTASFRSATYTNSSADPKYSYLAQWYVVYNRMYKNIPYHHDQQVIVMVHAQTGAIQAFNLVFPTPPPTNGPAKITSEQAIEVAKAQIAKSGLGEAVLKSCNQLVVQPNSWWTAPGPPKLQPGVSRIVWDCKYTSGRKRFDVWINTETGKIIGGEVIQSK